MLLLENKYGLFKKITYDKKYSDYEKQLKEYSDKLSKDLAVFEKNLEEKTNKSIKREKHVVEVSKNEKIQVLRNKSRESILKMREELIDDLSKELCKKYVDYIKTDEYFNNMLKDVEEYFENDKNIVYLVDEDIKRLNGEYSDRVKAMDSDKIGGFIVENKEDNTIIDNSLSEFIKEDRNNIGLIVQKFINKVGAEIE